MKQSSTLGALPGWIFVLALVLCTSSRALAAGNVTAYETRLNDQDGSLLKLGNDAVVEIRGGRIRRISGRPDCILFKKGIRWMIWIEGDDLYECDVEEDPRGIGNRADQERIMSIEYDGEVLLMEDGSIYEADRRDARRVSGWKAETEVLIFRGSKLLNLDDPRDLIRVRTLR